MLGTAGFDRRWSLASLSLAAVALFTSCAADDLDTATDDADAAFLDGKADSIADGSREARAVLSAANQANGDTLEDEIGLGRQTGRTATANILAYRVGPDGRAGTSDDRTFATLAELDAVRYVGPTAFAKLLRYVLERGLTETASIDVSRIASVTDFPAAPPAPGSYRIHLIDVGTGLAILVQGADFTLLFDGGSTDDSSGISASGNKSRLLAYLRGALGPGEGADCVPDGDAWSSMSPTATPRIDHVFLSHPHQDHSNMLDEVLRCYDVAEVWDAGAINDTASYADFLAAVVREPNVRYHTAIAPPDNRRLRVWGQTITFPASLRWTTFRAGDRRALGDGARLQVLHADGAYYANQFNDNSTVLRLDLGATSLLLAADAEAGLRDVPTAAVGEVEGALLDAYRNELDVDILQVGHHGSSTSSRREFLDAVSPRYALLSAGPTLNNGGVAFPDAVTIDSLSMIGAELLRTDANDSRCPEEDRIGVDNARPGGCDNYVLEIRAF